jgi:hypothetical protein
MATLPLLGTLLFVVAVTERLALLRFLSALSIVSLILVVIALALRLSERDTLTMSLALAIALPAGVAADFGVVTLTRYVAARGARTENRFWPLLVGVTSSLIAVIIFVGPLFFIRNKRLNADVVGVIVFFGLTNLYAAVIAASFVLVAASLLLQRMMWPIINRPLYAVHRFRLFQQRKVMFGAGSALIAFAWHQLSAWLGTAAQVLSS